MKMVFSVEELPHRYFNKACTNGARAGAHAKVKDGILWHDHKSPAAKILDSVTTPTVLINAATTRWAPYLLKAAVPPEYATVMTTCNYSALVFGDLEAMVSWLIDRATRECLNSADAHQEKVCQTHLLRMYCTEIETLLKLDWIDKVAHTRLTDQWAAVCKHWYLPEIDTRLITAVALRTAIEARASKALVDLTKVVDKCASATEKQQLAMAVTNDVSVHDLVHDIAHVRRAGFDAALPSRTFDVLRNLQRMERRAAKHKMYAEFKAWRAGTRALHASVTDLPKWMAAEYEKRTEFKHNVIRRRQAVDEAASIRTSKERLDSTNPEVRIEAAHYLLHRRSRVSTQIMERIVGKSVDELTVLIDAAIVERNAMRAEREARQVEERVVAIIETDIPRSLAKHHNTPRAWRAVDAPWAANIEQKARIKAANDAAAAVIAQRFSEVTPEQEYANGGQTPGAGDWLRPVGESALTSRGVKVPLRVALKTLAYLDAQPPGEFSCSVGVDAFTLRGRDADGRVYVGCHTFYPNAVELFRTLTATAQPVLETTE